MRVLKQRFLGSVLTKFFTVDNFENTSALTNIFSFKMFKIWCRFQKWLKKFRKRFSFFRELHLNCYLQILPILNRTLAILSQLLTNSTMTSPNTRGDIFQTNFPEKDEKTWSKCSHREFACIWKAFTCWLSRLVLKRRFLETGLNKIFTVSNFGKTLAMTNIFSSKMFKNWCRFQQCNKKFPKKFSFFR